MLNIINMENMIYDQIQKEFDCAEYINDDDVAKRLSAIIGYQARHCDTKIDDGVTDEDCEDKYVMKSSFIFNGIDLSVDMYYGDITREIESISINCK